jgi:RNA-directed DNA polymerase
VSFLPAVSAEAMKAMGQEIRSGHMAKRSDKSLDDLARMSTLWRRGGSTTTDAFTSPGCSTSSVGSTNHLVLWVGRKYKQRLRNRERRAMAWLAEIALPYCLRMVDILPLEIP